MNEEQVFNLSISNANLPVKLLACILIELREIKKHQMHALEVIDADLGTIAENQCDGR